MGSPFDAAYYRRYYDEAATRVHEAKEIAHLCAGVTAFAAWWKIPITSVLDVGAGVGLWRAWFREHRPKVAYRSTEISKHACDAYGHERRDISKWRAKESFDLVVCQGVLPYLDDAACARALDNLGAMTEGLLYLEAITKRDMRDVIDGDRTDVAVFPRTGAFYRSHLKKHFVQVGCGLWAKRDGPGLFYELEAAGR